MIELREPIESFEGLEGPIDRLEVVSIEYHCEPGREPHLDIEVRAGTFVAEVRETIEPEHAGWKMADAGPTRTCHDCGAVETWIEPEEIDGPPPQGQWSGEHDMTACLAAKSPEVRIVSAAYIEWIGGTSIIAKGEQLLESLGVARLVGGADILIQRMAEERS